MVMIITNYSIKDSESFDYKTSITEKLVDSNAQKDDVTTVVSLEYLSNFWRTLDMPLINCETSKATRDWNDNPLVVAPNNPTNATFKIKDSKLYVPVVTLSAENDKKLLEQLKTGFQKTIKWNKYR